MLLERYYDDSLAQASYLIGCERAREAIVIDANRGVRRYLEAAESRRMRIRFVTETHIHADYLSGSRELARAARAELLLSDHGGADWSYGLAGSDGARLLRDGDSIEVGAVRLEVRHTPGHTPEHISFLATDTATGDRPLGMITGDFVFVGDVGRPDLLELAAKIADTMESAARQLFGSLQKLRALPDWLQLWPGHGAGSACGKSLGSVPQTTLGYERLYNPAFQHAREEDFVRWVLADQPEPPAYFAVMKRLNRDGPPTRPATDPVQLEADAVADSLERGDWVVDVRSSRDFSKGHVVGTINVPSGKSLPTYAGTVLSYDRPIVLVAQSREQALAAVEQLALIGMDRVAGWIPFAALRDGGRRVTLAGMPLVDAATLAAETRRDGPRVIDVRGRPEWNDGHLPGATHIYLGDLPGRLGEFDKSEPLVVHCASGSRSSIAASLMRARGFTNVVNFAGGTDAWRKEDLPFVK